MTRKIDRREFIVGSGATTGFAALKANPLQAKSARVQVLGLKVDYIDRPLGLENPQPRLSWRLQSSARNARQTAYRILVASREELLKEGKGNLWDSGKIESSKSFGIPYAGSNLTSRQRCWWCVQVWDERGESAGYSDVSWWEMGLLDPKDWTAQWLAIEDAVTKADREAGLQWIWGASSNDEGKRRFRCKVQLPAAASAGELCAVLSAYWFAKVTGIWIDGEPLIDPTSIDWLGQWVRLPAISAGEHLIAIEVSPPPAAFNSRPRALAFFARFHLATDEMLRIRSSPQWKTSLVQDNEWYTPRYDDKAWETARTVTIENYQPWPARPAMFLRHEFSLTRPVVRARLYATALGAYEARLNARRVGDALLTPEVSQYAKRALYRVYDVTPLMKSGTNVLGLTVGDGWYASFNGRFEWGVPPRRVLVQLELIFEDGSRQIVATGPGWRGTESPIRTSEIRVGEVYDARLEQPGWDTAPFDDSHWQAVEISERPACHLTAQTSPPICALQTLTPRTISQLKPAVYVIDFGQCFAGWCRLRVQGVRGSRIELRFGEVLTPSGEVEQSWLSIGEPKCDVYVLKGDPSGETFEPHFTYRGFRYVQVTGLPTEPTVHTLEGVVVHSDLEMTGRLRTDAPLIERIWRNTVWTQRSNFVAIPTDCPSREQQGWMGDAGVFWDAAAFNMDICAFTARQMQNVLDDQLATGAFPMFAPEAQRRGAFWHADGTPPAWSDGSIILPWTAWQRYGDTAIIERNWEAMNRHLDFVLERNPDYVWKNGRGPDLGDHLDLAQISLPGAASATPKDLIGTAYWANSARLLAQMAKAIGRTADAKRLDSLSDRIRHAFNNEFVKADGNVGNGSQTSYILALRFGLLPEKVRQAATQRLVADIRSRGVSLTTGILGTQFSLDVLTDAGFPDLAYDLLLRTEYPSWGHMIGHGATTMWEAWSHAIPANRQPQALSQNHYALGAICGFLFRRMAGIDAAAPGFTTIVVRPVLDSRVKQAGADYDSMMGRISTDWTQGPDGRFELNVTIPANTAARIHLPAPRTSRIKESGREISRHRDVRMVSRLDEEVTLEIGSGAYRFVVVPENC